MAWAANGDRGAREALPSPEVGASSPAGRRLSAELLRRRGQHTHVLPEATACLDVGISKSVYLLNMITTLGRASLSGFTSYSLLR